jgi:hypothetical protein
MRRVILAGLLGGLALFAWESVAHLLLPLGQAGIKTIDNEQAVVASLRDNVKQSGLYFFPAAAATGTARAGGPTGILAFQPMGTMSMMPSQLLTQLGADIVAMIIAGILLAQAGGFPGFGKRVLFFTLMGVLPALRTDLSYWNWYAFPTVYTAAQFTVNIVGFCLAGLVLAKITATRPAALTKGHASA